jgi:hypothetical protein
MQGPSPASKSVGADLITFLMVIPEGLMRRVLFPHFFEGPRDGRGIPSGQFPWYRWWLRKFTVSIGRPEPSPILPAP